MDLNTRRRWKCSSGRALVDYGTEPRISGCAGSSCGPLVTRTFLPFWADQVWIDLVADVLIGSSKVGQALTVAIRHWESKQKRGSDCKCSYVESKSRFRGCLSIPSVHSFPSPNRFFLLKHTQDLMMLCVCEVECYSVWQIFIKYELCARSLVQQFKPQICRFVGCASRANIHQHFCMSVIYTVLIIWQPCFQAWLLSIKHDREICTVFVEIAYGKKHDVTTKFAWSKHSEGLKLTGSC